MLHSKKLLTLSKTLIACPLMKPKTWQECPEEVLRKLLENIDLEYCRYESSQVETVHEILNYRGSSAANYNKFILERMWGRLTDEEFSKMVLFSIDGLEYDLALLKYNAAFNKWISCSDSELKEAETNLNLCRNKYYYQN